MDFPDEKSFLKELKEVVFFDLKATSLTGGIAKIYQGKKFS